MGSRQNEIRTELKKFKDRTTRFGVKRIILFGSAAKSSFKKFSDIDLIVVSKKLRNLGPYKNSSILYSNWRLNLPVDFLCYTPEEFEKLKKQVSIVSEALREGIEI